MSIPEERRSAGRDQDRPASRPAAATASGDSAAADAVVIERVSKTFKLYHNAVKGPVLELLHFWRKDRYSTPFMAVRDVSFRVKRGEVVGLVGPNGAGKTTLLKMVAGLLPVDSGTISVHGRVTALLALGVGVHPEFTGRENIHYSGLLLGMSKAEIAAKTPSIIEFAEIGDFIDRPFRTYSSGMRARLLFSISMSIDPDVLIVDEALATGDAYFVAKCARRIRELCSSGATVLFVSHNLGQVQELCDRAILMIGGAIVDEGSPQQVVAAYYAWAFSRETVRTASRPSALIRSGGSGEVEIHALRVLGPDGTSTTGLHSGEGARIEFDYSSRLEAGRKVVVFVGLLRASDGAWVGELCSRYHVDPFSHRVSETPVLLVAAGTVVIDMPSLLLLNDAYTLWVMIYDNGGCHCEYRGIAPFFVARRAHVFDRGPVFWQPCRFTTLPGDVADNAPA